MLFMIWDDCVHVFSLSIFYLLYSGIVQQISLNLLCHDNKVFVLKSNPTPILCRAKNRSTPLCSGWTTPRPVSTSGSVQWSIMLSSGWEDPYKRTLHALVSYAWDHVSDTGNRCIQTSELVHKWTLHGSNSTGFCQEWDLLNNVQPCGEVLSYVWSCTGEVAYSAPVSALWWYSKKHHLLKKGMHEWLLDVVCLEYRKSAKWRKISLLIRRKFSVSLTAHKSS